MRLNMMNGTALVTGVAGFIGSHLAEQLVKKGFNVVGVDSFEDYYPRWMKAENLNALLNSPEFTFVEGNLLSDSFFPCIQTRLKHKNIDYVFHEAAQPGVRMSWQQFRAYVDNNILATHKLLEFVKELHIKKLIFSSSSSVYGNSDNLPVTEDACTAPISPYGMTKLAAESLCRIYWQNFNIPITILRYFTVYGPRQRPDMALHKFVRAVLDEREIQVFGDGRQTRDFTFVSDIVEATTLAASAPPGEIFNIGGGTRIAIMDAIALVESLTGKKALIKQVETQKGDVQDTWADVEKAKRRLGYQPGVSLEQGLKEQISWLKQAYRGH